MARERRAERVNVTRVNMCVSPAWEPTWEVITRTSVINLSCFETSQACSFFFRFIIKITNSTRSPSLFPDKTSTPQWFPDRWRHHSGSQTGDAYHMKLKNSVSNIFHEIPVIPWTLRLGLSSPGSTRTSCTTWTFQVPFFR